MVQGIAGCLTNAKKSNLEHARTNSRRGCFYFAHGKQAKHEAQCEALASSAERCNNAVCVHETTSRSPPANQYNQYKASSGSVKLQPVTAGDLPKPDHRQNNTESCQLWCCIQERFSQIVYTHCQKCNTFFGHHLYSSQMLKQYVTNIITNTMKSIFVTLGGFIALQVH